MLKARMEYGAVTAKVLALYGRLLSPDDWQHACECSSTAELLTLLKALPGWSGYLTELSAAAGAEDIKKAIAGKQRRDYEKLYAFCSLEDKEMLDLLRHSTQLEAVGAGESSCDYDRLFSDLDRKYHGSGRAQLRRLLGAQADVLNIISILRLHRYFPASLAGAESLLVPVYGRLKPKLVSALLSARSEQEATELLKTSGFKDFFADYKPQELDRLYEGAMSGLCRRIIKLPEPNLCVPVAYLVLSRLECERLIRITQALSYGMKPGAL